MNNEKKYRNMSSRLFGQHNSFCKNVSKKLKLKDFESSKYL